MKTPHGRSAANNLLARAIHAVLEIRRIRGQNAKEIQTLQELLNDTRQRVDHEIAPHREFLAEALPALARWFLLNLDRYGKGRQIELDAGTLGARLSSSFRVEVTGDEADVIDRVAALGDEYIITTRRLNHDAIAADRDKFIGFKGLRFTIRDTLEAKSPMVLMSEDEKQLVRTPLRVWRNPGKKPVVRRAKQS